MTVKSAFFAFMVESTFPLSVESSLTAFAVKTALSTFSVESYLTAFAVKTALALVVIVIIIAATRSLGFR